jgi:Predicted membrane protein
MTDTSATAPTDPTSRIHSLDVLRGIAILGILIINIQLFSDPAALFLNPTLSDSFTGLNYVTWVFTHVFAQQNFLTIFSVLFGASIALFMEKKSGSQHSAIVLHYRRMFWLFVIGVMHTYLLWNGDILASYAVSAAIVVWARHWTPINQLLAGIGVATVGSIHELSFAVRREKRPTVDGRFQMLRSKLILPHTRSDGLNSSCTGREKSSHRK